MKSGGLGGESGLGRGLEQFGPVLKLLQSVQRGAGVALVAAAAPKAAPLVTRVTHTRGAPLQVTQQEVCALHIHIQVLL